MYKTLLLRQQLPPANTNKGKILPLSFSCPSAADQHSFSPKLWCWSFDARHLLEWVWVFLYKPWQIVVLCQARVCVSTWAQSYGWGAWSLCPVKPPVFCNDFYMWERSRSGRSWNSLKYSSEGRLSSVSALLPCLLALAVTGEINFTMPFLSVNYLHLEAIRFQRKRINDKKTKPLSPLTKWSSRRRSWPGEIDRLATIFIQWNILNGNHTLC